MLTTNNENKFRLENRFIKKHLYQIENDMFDPNAFVLDFIPVRAERYRKYQQYTTEHNAIDDRVMPESEIVKVFNKIHSSYFNFIVDQGTGYVYGNPISLNYANSVGEKSKTWIEEFLKKQNMAIKQNLLGTQQGATGTAFLLVDMDGDLPTLRCIDSWDAYVIDQQKAAVYFEDGYVKDGFVKYMYLITPDKITTYRSNVDFDWSTPAFTKQDDGTIDNLIGHVTLAEYKNNDGSFCDFETVEDLNDAADRLMSSVQDEVEQFRWAYMMIYGTLLDKVEAEKILKTQTGILNITEPDGRAEFLTKDIPTEFFSFISKMLNDNIYKFSKSIDLNDPAFAGGNESGEARKWKVMQLELKAKLKENFFKDGYNATLEALLSYMRTKLSYNDLDIEDITQQFTRSLPVDTGYIADTINKLSSFISKETALSMIPGINPKDEMEKKYAEMKEGQAILDQYGPFGNGGVEDGKHVLGTEEGGTPKGNDDEGEPNAKEA
ncbi:phage portal protein [Listeria sp. SHR_NRA_18]|uniref:phage portal protein n=1 Tax=Listeria sp. SHR_NRA_18 TaxID=2269046 RepID=UPI000F5D9999|nr:phage portal protein [Listeria sp. SHR_NRA_18]RQW65691.1 phage portal protein [Listeria sp. SHR_NRA_18]